jgi:hypothetical protein
MNDILAGGSGRGGPSQDIRPNALRLSGRTPVHIPENVDFLPVEIELENRTKTPVTLGAIENARVGKIWSVTIDGRVADLFLSSTERQRLVAPGQSIVCRGKIFPETRLNGKEEVLVEFNCGEIYGEPFWYRLLEGEQRASA